MASNPITSWQIIGEKVEAVTDFIFLGSKITADGDHNHEIQRCLFLGRKVMTNLAYSKAETSLCRQKVCIIKAMVFPVDMYGCMSWTIKKAEHWRIDASELWCWRRLLDCKGTKPVNIKGYQPRIFIGMTDAKVQYFGANSRLIGKDLDAGKYWRQKEKGWQGIRWLDSITD